MYQQDIRFYKTGHERLTDSTLAYMQQDICSCTRTQHTQGVYPGYDIYDVAARINVLSIFFVSTGHVQGCNRTYTFNQQYIFVLTTGHKHYKNRTLTILQQGICLCINRTYDFTKQDMRV